MAELTVVVMAAGMGSRFGGLKQLAPVGPGGEAIIDHTVRLARTAGFTRAVVVVRAAIEEQVRTHLAERWPAGMELALVAQDGDERTAGLSRSKPLGTAHAVLVARPLVPGPFSVVNADDLYGPDAHRLLGEALAAGTSALVAFRVDRTLLGERPVTRALVAARDGRLVAIDEGHVGHEGGLSWSDGTRTVALAGDELVSMNCWGFQPAVFEVLEEAVARFLREGAPPAHEVLLPDVIREALRTGALGEIAVLPTDDRCLGVTHPEDTALLAAAWPT